MTGINFCCQPTKLAFLFAREERPYHRDNDQGYDESYYN
uniref:Uncharacterized protein n=1 Tax=Caudovirales sp. ctIZM3 TaxID=2827633 RepID=A0A8S5T8J7_9CAUD|nr:MAG TPA: hypothetical protein [Caudovirales sp. ctIZM3]